MTDARAAGGVLPVDKPAGPTSHDVVAVARRALGTRRIGHAGTLDPFATGLLLLCVDAGTRLAEFLTGMPKSYRATVKLGERTTTHDPEGEVVARSEAWRGLDAARVEAFLAALRGPILQRPPRYSAKKIAGESAHYRVRRGEEVELAPVGVEVHELEMVAFAPPELELSVRCSSGTYVRALARDLGEALGTGAHLTALRRTAVGPFRVEDAVAASALQDAATVARAWIEPAAALAHLPQAEVTAEDAVRIGHGQTIGCPSALSGAAPGPIAALHAGALVAVVERDGDRLRPRKVFAGGPA